MRVYCPGDVSGVPPQCVTSVSTMDEGVFNLLTFSIILVVFVLAFAASNIVVPASSWSGASEAREHIGTKGSIN